MNRVPPIWKVTAKVVNFFFSSGLNGWETKRRFFLRQQVEQPVVEKPVDVEGPQKIEVVELLEVHTVESLQVD